MLHIQEEQTKEDYTLEYGHSEKKMLSKSQQASDEILMLPKINGINKHNTYFKGDTPTETRELTP